MRESDYLDFLAPDMVSRANTTVVSDTEHFFGLDFSKESGLGPISLHYERLIKTEGQVHSD